MKKLTPLVVLAVLHTVPHTVDAIDPPQSTMSLEYHVAWLNRHERQFGASVSIGHSALNASTAHADWTLIMSWNRTTHINITEHFSTPWFVGHDSPTVHYNIFTTRASQQALQQKVWPLRFNARILDNRDLAAVSDDEMRRMCTPLQIALVGPVSSHSLRLHPRADQLQIINLTALPTNPPPSFQSARVSPKSHATATLDTSTRISSNQSSSVPSQRPTTTRPLLPGLQQRQPPPLNGSQRQATDGPESPVPASTPSPTPPALQPPFSVPDAGVAASEQIWPYMSASVLTFHIIFGAVALVNIVGILRKWHFRSSSKS